MRLTRRRLLATVTAGIGGLAGCGQGSGPAKETDPGERETTGTTETGAEPPDSVGLETVAGDLQVPLDIAFAPAADRRYVVTRPGRVLVHDPGGLREEPFLDLRESVVTGGGYSERGLLGLALHPEFADNRRVFARYSAPSRPGTPDEYSHTFVLAEFEATADGGRVDPDSERAVLEIPQPQSNHNAGDIAFGPDGHLYVAVGDGGGGGDNGPGHVEDWYDAVPGGNGQDVTESLLGGVLRIDVDGGEPYAVPEDNPLVGREGLDEYYAWGFRNPWRLSFDGGDLIVADVGQNDFEEINLVEAGGNYGWNVREGRGCYGAEDCPSRTPRSVRGGEVLRDPVVAYPHADAPVSGVSVIGGAVYRGSTLPGLAGRYVFADLRAEGELFVATPTGDGWPVRTLPVEGGADVLGTVYAFGRAPDGELYVLGGRPRETAGVHRLVPA